MLLVLASERISKALLQALSGARGSQTSFVPRTRFAFLSAQLVSQSRFRTVPRRGKSLKIAGRSTFDGGRFCREESCVLGFPFKKEDFDAALQPIEFDPKFRHNR